jgi:hypothetical protein
MPRSHSHIFRYADTCKIEREADNIERTTVKIYIQIKEDYFSFRISRSRIAYR